MKKALAWLFEPFGAMLFSFMVSMGFIMCAVESAEHELEGEPKPEAEEDEPEPEAEEDEPEPEAEEDEPEPEHTPQSRREARVQKLANERAEAMAEAKAAKEQAEFYRRQAEQMQQQQRTPPKEDEYVDPDEKWRRDTESKVNQALFSAQDLNDQAAYTLQAAKNPLYAKYSDKVEAQLREVRAKGGNANREGILSYLIGQDALKNHGKATPAAKQASQRVAAAKTTTPGAKSNVAAPRSDKSLEERLLNQIL